MGVSLGEPNALYVPALPDDHWSGCHSERYLALGSASNRWFDAMVSIELSTAVSKEPEVYEHNLKLLEDQVFFAGQ